MHVAFVGRPENELAGVGSHAGKTGPMPNITYPCDKNHTAIDDFFGVLTPSNRFTCPYEPVAKVESCQIVATARDCPV